MSIICSLLKRKFLSILIAFFVMTICGYHEAKACCEVDKDKIIRLQREKNLLDALRSPQSLNIATTGNCSIVSTIKAPDDDTEGLAWDTGNLWVSEGNLANVYKNMILKIDTAGNILSFFNAPGQSSLGPRPFGLAFDGAYLWNVDFLDEKIYKLTKAGSVISSIPAPSGIPSGIAWDGQYLWVSEWYSYKIYKIIGVSA